eukprot:gene30809-35839_t
MPRPASTGYTTARRNARHDVFLHKNEEAIVPLRLQIEVVQQRAAKALAAEIARAEKIAKHDLAFALTLERIGRKEWAKNEDLVDDPMVELEDSINLVDEPINLVDYPINLTDDPIDLVDDPVCGAAGPSCRLSRSERKRLSYQASKAGSSPREASHAPRSVSKAGTQLSTLSVGKGKRPPSDERSSPERSSSSSKKRRKEAAQANNSSAGKAPIEPDAKSTRAPKFSCNICFDDFSAHKVLSAGDMDRPSSSSGLPGCGHHTCRDCMRQYVRSQLAERKVVYSVVVSLLRKGKTAEEDLKALREAELRSAIDPSQRLYCPHKKCSALLMRSEDDQRDSPSECPKCYRLFCPTCLVPGWHKVTP